MEQTQYKRPIKKKKKKYKNDKLITNIILCIIALAALTGCIVLLLQNQMLRQQSVEVMTRLQEAEGDPKEIVFTEAEAQAIAEAMAEQAVGESKAEMLDTLKEKMKSGEGPVSMLRYFYPDEIIVYADSEYYFFPISDSLKKHSYTYENFIMDDKSILTYQSNTGTPLSRKGIDVSRYQNQINWTKVAGDGVEYAFIRLGIRGSSEGKLVLDETYEDNIKGAVENGIEAGVYFFTQALNEEEAVEEAEFVLDAIEPYNVTYPIVLDVEDVATKNPRTKDMTREDWTKVTIAFCERIKEAGYTPMIYGNLKTFMLMLDMEQLEPYEKWYAYYNTPLYFPYEFSIWQYSSTGKVDGIQGDVDLNVCMKDMRTVEND